MANRRGRAAIEIGGVRVEAGRRRRVELAAARLATGTTLTLPVLVIHGRREGPRVWISSTVHGDELNGVEILRRVLRELDARTLRGTVLAVPVVNVHGFVHQSRYLPDRRDLNRSFPGSSRGSLAARIAHLFMTEVVGHATHGIDLHTGSLHRENLPQIRADLDDDATRQAALAFGAPVTVHDRGRDGSLREAAARRGIPALLFEGGGTLRFDRDAIEVGTSGVLRVLTALDLGSFAEPAVAHATARARVTGWVRARVGGMVDLDVGLGDRVASRDVLGTVRDVFGARLSVVRANRAGLVIGINRNPLVTRGDAVVHVAETEPPAVEGDQRVGSAGPETGRETSASR